MGELNQTAVAGTEKKRSAGGLWRRKTREDKTYFSGQLELVDGERINFVAFVNDYASENERAPAYKIFLSDSQPVKSEETTTPAKKVATAATKPVATKTVVKKVVAKAPEPEPEEEIVDEEILLD